MKTRLVGGAVAVVIALGVLLVPSPAPAEAASSSCTGWTSRLVPPTTIRVLRTATRRTVTVDFRTYVEKVMPAEWGPANPAAALQAGAVAIKQYAWYYALEGHWRGGKDAAGRCYDVRDDSIDQVYDPARTPAASHVAAIDATWWWSIRRDERLALTGYRPGTKTCPGTIDGYRLYQRNAATCAKQGWSAEKILRTYYSTRSSPAMIIVLGRNDMTGDLRGDSAGVLTDPASDEVTVRLYTNDPALDAATLAAASSQVVDTMAGEALLGRDTTDATGDGLLDVVQLVAREDDTVVLEVLAATPTGFSPAVTWWTSAAGQFVPTELSLVAGDFNANGRGDAALLERTVETTRLLLLTSNGASFTWRGQRLAVERDLTAARAIGGDFDGDGRTDVAFLLPDGPPETATGTVIEVATTRNTADASGSVTLSVAAPVPWLTEPTPLASIKAVAADVDRNGRDDLYLVVPAGDDVVQVVAALSKGSAFSRRLLYAETADPITWSLAKPVAADTNRDGRTDLLLVVDRGRDESGASLGITIIRLKSYGTSLGSRVLWKTDPGADWTLLDPR